MEFRRKTLVFLLVIASSCAFILSDNSDNLSPRAASLQGPESGYGDVGLVNSNSQAAEDLDPLAEVNNPTNSVRKRPHRTRRLVPQDLRIVEIDDNDRYAADDAGIIALAIKKHYLALEMQSPDVQEFYNLLFDSLKDLDDIEASLAEGKSSTAKVIDALLASNIRVPEVELATEIDSQRLAEELQGVRGFLSSLAHWYLFLIVMHNTLSEYKPQLHRAELRNTDLYDACSEGELVTQESVEGFAKKLDPFSKAKRIFNEYQRVKDMELNAPRAEAICKLLEVSLDSTVTMSCLEDGRMQVKGDIVKLSDITTYCPGDLKVLEIFALNMVYLDKDLDERDKKLQLVIAAPQWEVIGEGSCEAAMTYHNATREFRDWLCRPSPENMDSFYWFLRCENPMFRTNLPEDYIKYCRKRGDDDPTSRIAVFGNLCNLDGKTDPSSNPKVCPATFVPRNGNGRLGFLYEYMRNRCPAQINSLCKLNNRGNSVTDPLEDAIAAYRSSSPVKRVIDLSGLRVDSFPKMRANRANNVAGINGGAGLPGKPGKPGGNFIGIGRYFAGLNKLMVLAHGGRGGIGEMGSAGKVGNNNQRGRGGDGGKGGSGGHAGSGQLLAVDKISRFAELQLKAEDGEDGADGFGGWPGGMRVDQDPYQLGNSFGITGGNKEGAQEPEESVLYRSLATVANDYKLYMLENMNNRWYRYTLTEMHDSISNSADIEQNYRTIDYVNELINLERMFLLHYGEYDFLQFYQEFQQRVEDYVKKRGEKSMSPEERKISLFLRAAALSKICALQNNARGSLVIHIRKLLKNVIADIKKLQQTSTDVAIKKYNDDYQKEVDAKIGQANKFIHATILPEINNIYGHIDRQIDGLLAEASGMKDKIAENRRAIQLTAAMKKGFVILNGVSIILPLFVSGADKFNTVLKSIIPTGQNLLPVIEKQKVPQGVDRLLKDTTPYFKRLRDDKERVLGELLKVIEQDSSGLLADLRNTTAYVKDNVKIISYNDEFDVIKTALVNLEFKLSHGPSSKSVKDALSVLQIVQEELLIAEQSPETYLKYKQEPEKMKSLVTIIKDKFDNGAEADVKALNEYEDKIYEIIVPMMNNMQADVSSVVNNLDGESLAALNVVKWRTVNMIRDIGNKLTQYTTDFKVKEPLDRWIEKLDEAFSTVIAVYERKQTYLEHLKLTNYIAKVHSKALQGVTSDDPAVAKALADLRFITQSNVVMGQYQRIMNAFKQFIFPFADHYLDIYDLQQDVSNMTIEDRVQKAVNQLEELKAKLDTSDALFEDFKENIRKADFDTTTRRSNGPFYTWKNETHKDTLSALLSGQRVLVRADLSKGFHGNAVKFRKIGIRFVSADENIPQADLDKALEIFDAHMTHMGNSHYKCDNKCYLMGSRNVTIKYSFQLNDAGKPVDANEAYELIGEGDFMLSPYAMWGLKLVGFNQQDFADLERFKGRVHLQLQGQGKYVEANNDVCLSNRLGLYYQETTCT